MYPRNDVNPEAESVMHHRMVMDRMNDSHLPEFMKNDVSTGTTIVAIQFEGGVVMGTDSRTSSGSFVVSRATDKLERITDRIYACRSGSAADTQAIAEMARYNLNFLEMENNERPSVKTAVNVFRDMLYGYRDQLLASMIVAGWDKQRGGQVYALPLGGMVQRNPFVLGGSGSSFCYGYADRNYKPNMTKDECLTFASDVLTLAMNRDGSSGGLMNFAVITESGVERFRLKGKEMPAYYQA